MRGKIDARGTLLGRQKGSGVGMRRRQPDVRDRNPGELRGPLDGRLQSAYQKSVDVDHCEPLPPVGENESGGFHPGGIDV